MRPLLIAITALVTLTACETVGGAGRDIETAGRYVQGAAQQVQEDL